MWIVHRKGIRKLTFRALALRRSEGLTLEGSDEGLTLETSASESLYCGQFTLSTQLIKPNYLINQLLRFWFWFWFLFLFLFLFLFRFQLRIPTGRRQTSWLFTGVGFGFELGATVKQIKVVVRAGIEPGTAGLWVRRAHYVTLHYFNARFYLNYIDWQAQFHWQ